MFIYLYIIYIFIYLYIYIYFYIKNFLPHSIPRRITQFKAKLQRYRKLLYRRNKTICRYKKKDLRYCRTWEDITANLSGVQKTFFEMMSRNFHHASEVCLLINKKFFILESNIKSWRSSYVHFKYNLLYIN